MTTSRWPSAPPESGPSIVTVVVELFVVEVTVPMRSAENGTAKLAVDPSSSAAALPDPPDIFARTDSGVPALRDQPGLVGPVAIQPTTSTRTKAVTKAPTARRVG